MESTSAPEELYYGNLYKEYADELAGLDGLDLKNIESVGRVLSLRDWLVQLHTGGKLRQFEEYGGNLNFANLLTILENCRKSESLSPLARKSTGMR